MWKLELDFNPETPHCVRHFEQHFLSGVSLNDDELTIVFYFIFLTFYRAMHCSAKRGIAIACRLSAAESMCLSVRL